MLLKQRNNETFIRTQALAETLKEVAAELRLVDLSDFVTFIQREQFANIQDLVNSSIELFFKHGTLTYAAMATFELAWDHPPTVTIGMEFHHNSISVLFDLVLHTHDAGIEIRAMSFGDKPVSPEGETAALIAAIAAARLVRADKTRNH